jgi:hypothetical protein
MSDGSCLPSRFISEAYNLFSRAGPFVRTSLHFHMSVQLLHMLSLVCFCANESLEALFIASVACVNCNNFL